MHRFLQTEIIPQVAARYAPRNPAGGESVVVAAAGNRITDAWHQLDQFSRVIASSTSFVQLPDGNIYPDLIAASPCIPVTHLPMVKAIGRSARLTPSLRAGHHLGSGPN